MKHIATLFFIILCSIEAQANFEQLAKQALRRNLQLQAAKLEIKQSLIDITTADNKMIPNLNLNATGMQKNFESSPATVDSSLAFSLRLAQTYPALGRIPRINRRIARLRAQISETMKRQQETTILRKLSDTYFGLLRDQEIIKAHTTDLLLIDELLRIAHLHREVGLVLDNDVLRIDVEKLNSSSALLRAQNSYQNLKYDLAALLDYDDPQKIEISLPKGIKFTCHTFDPKILLNKVFENDNEIITSNTNIDILNQSINAAKSANLPTLSLESSYNYSARAGNSKDNRDLTTTFVLTTPVYDSGDIDNSIRAAKNAKKIAQLRLSNLKNNKRAAIEKSLSDYNEAVARIKLAEKMFEQSFENMRIVFSRYQEGVASIVELVDAQLLITNTAQNAIRAYYDERSALSEIFILTEDFESLYKIDLNPVTVNFDFLLQTLEIQEF